MISKIKDLENFFKNKNFHKILIISGKKSFKKIEGSKLISSFLNKEKKEIFYYFKESPYPEVKELKKIIFFIKKIKPHIILAIGGGSVIDYAKIANIKDLAIDTSLKIKNKEYNSKKKISRLVVLPTTAGSGAEVTSSAVIYLNKIKYSVEGEGIVPDYFFLLPQLIVRNNKKLKSSAGFDAISQSIESIISVRSNKKSLFFAKKSLQLSLPNFTNFYNNPNQYNSSLMSLAAMYSGKAINISKTTAPHAVSYPFTSLYGISHGHAVSLTLEKFLHFNFKNIKYSNTIFDLSERFKILFKILNLKNISELEKKIKVIKRNTNLEDNFKKLKININSDYNKILNGINDSRLSNNPIKLSKKDVKNILLK